MLTASPRSFFSRHFTVRDQQGQAVAELDLAALRERAELRHEGKTYSVGREKLMSGPWIMMGPEGVLFEANKPKLLRNRFELCIKGAWLELAPRSWTLRRFGLVGPDWADLGEVRKASLLSRKLEIDLADQVPRLAQLFILFLALVIWRRQEQSH